MKYLKSPIDEKRRKAIDILGEMRAKSRVSDLLPLLRHPDLDTRLRAINSLSKIDDRRAIKPLLRLAQIDSGLVRRQSLSAIGGSGPKASEAIDALFEMLRSSDASDDIAEIHMSGCDICTALGSIGPKSLSVFEKVLAPSSNFTAITKKYALICLPAKSLEAKSREAVIVSKLLLSYLRCNNKTLATTAATKLYELPGFAVHIKKELEQFGLTATSSMRKLIGASLWTSGVHSPEAMQIILQGLSDADPTAQFDSLWAIRKSKLTGNAVKPHLVRLLRATNDEVVADVIRTIETVGTYESFAGELQRIADSSMKKDLVAAARKAIGYLKQKSDTPP